MDTSKAIKAFNTGEQTIGIQQVSRGRQKFEDKMKLHFRKICSKDLVCYEMIHHQFQNRPSVLAVLKLSNSKKLNNQ
jgi:hypothetical protein